MNHFKIDQFQKTHYQINPRPKDEYKATRYFLVAAIACFVLMAAFYLFKTAVVSHYFKLGLLLNS